MALDVNAKKVDLKQKTVKKNEPLGYININTMKGLNEKYIIVQTCLRMIDGGSLGIIGEVVR